MPIHLLSPEIASQIAAGEVIERPASVVKELIENAIDAGATFISVMVEQGGQQLIEVSDNGAGIDPLELALAVERHATSKLDSADDLFQIQTLGFRGEALASIASVAQLTLVSRPQTAESGARIKVDGGFPSAVQVTGAATGTMVRVENLFYNVPARLKFLKKEITERRQIDNLVARYALAYPHIRFQLKQEGRISLQTSGNGQSREVLSALFGVDIARQMLEVIASDRDISIRGFISPTSITRSNRKDITFFVNGRPVQDPTLVSAFLKGYHTLLMVGRYPLGVLFLEMPPETVDVNVHPTKAEVRFRQSDQIFSNVQNAVRRALLAYNPVSQVMANSPWQLPTSKPGSDWTQRGTWDWDRHQPSAPGNVSGDGEGSSETLSHRVQPAFNQSKTPLLRSVGQIANAFLVAEGPDGLYLIDQHAAHERILFERFTSQKVGEIPAQTLLQPETVDFPAAAARLLADQIPLLARLGFQVEPFGPQTFIVRAIPEILKGSSPADALRVLVEDFEEDETPLQTELENRLIARICKRAAVKAGKTLSPEEQRALVVDLEMCASPRTCPHGRPTMIHLSVDLLERQFGRKGAR